MKAKCKEAVNDTQANTMETYKGLYTNQEEMQFGIENRLFVIFVDTTDMSQLLEDEASLFIDRTKEVNDYVNKFDENLLKEINFTFNKFSYKTLSDVIFWLKE